MIWGKKSLSRQIVLCPWNSQIMILSGLSEPKIYRGIKVLNVLVMLSDTRNGSLLSLVPAAPAHLQRLWETWGHQVWRSVPIPPPNTFTFFLASSPTPSEDRDSSSYTILHPCLFTSSSILPQPPSDSSESSGFFIYWPCSPCLHTH